MAQVVLQVDYVVFTGEPGVDYSRVNGMSTEVEGLDQWLGVRNVATSLDGPMSPIGEVTVTIKEPTTDRVDRRLNLSLTSGAKWQRYRAVLAGPPSRTTQ